MPGLEVEREVDGRGEALVPVLVEEEVVGGDEELLGRQRPQQATEGTGEQQGTGAGPLPLAGDVDHDDVEAVAVAGRDDEVAGEGRAAGRAQLAAHVPAVRQRRDAALLEDAVAQVDQHRLAAQPGHARAGTAGSWTAG